MNSSSNPSAGIWYVRGKQIIAKDQFSPMLDGLDTLARKAFTANSSQQPDALGSFRPTTWEETSQWFAQGHTPEQGRRMVVMICVGGSQTQESGRLILPSVGQYVGIRNGQSMVIDADGVSPLIFQRDYTAPEGRPHVDWTEKGAYVDCFMSYYATG